MSDDLIERLRALSRHEHSDYSIGDEAAAALEAAQRAVVIATGERNRVQAKWDKCRINLRAAREDAAEAKQNGYELGLLAAAREDAERWNELCRQIDAGEFHPSILDDAMNMGAGALEMHVDAAIDAAREARNG